MKNKRNFRMKHFFIVFCLTSIESTGCFHKINDICSKDFNEIGQRVDWAVNQLEHSQKEEPDWKEWSVDQLKETQNYLDLLDSGPKIKTVRTRISYIANLWVEFFGYAEMLDKKNSLLDSLRNASDPVATHRKMLLILRQIQSSEYDLKELVCQKKTLSKR